MDDREAERQAILAIALRAGVLPSEMREDPVHGLCISLSGVEKMARVTPDTAVKMQTMAAFRAFSDEMKGRKP